MLVWVLGFRERRRICANFIYWQIFKRGLHKHERSVHAYNNISILYNHVNVLTYTLTTFFCILQKQDDKETIILPMLICVAISPHGYKIFLRCKFSFNTTFWPTINYYIFITTTLLSLSKTYMDLIICIWSLIMLRKETTQKLPTRHHTIFYVINS